MEMKKTLALLMFAVAPLLSAFAISGRTMYHYIAYEAAFWPKSAPVSGEQYQKINLDPLAKLPFDTLVFAPVFGFGSFAGKLQGASYPKQQPSSRWMSNWKNGMPELMKQGADPIAETSKWCRKNKKEAVVALPVNLIVHGARPTSEHPLSSWYAYLWPDFKTENPGCTMDNGGKDKVALGSGFYVDYTQAKVRDTFASNASEIAAKYDIDGIMVDFTMAPMLFRSVADGGVAAPKEVTLITEMMQRIKTACKAASGRLKHPVALAARVPDSIGYCKGIGIDLQGWLDTRLLDYVVLGGAFQLNRWNAVGDLALKAGVPFYASFTQSGITVYNDSGYSGDDERIPRNHKDVCNARIADALLCKAAGCMYTMGLHWEVQFPRNLCEPYDAKYNRTADKRYFVSYTNDRAANKFLKDGFKYRVPPSLLSGAPVDLSKGMVKYTIEVWDDFAALAKDGIVPQVSLVTEASLPSGIEIDVTFNGKPVKAYRKRAGAQFYELAPKSVKIGGNEVTVKAKGKNKRGQTATLGNIAVEVKFPKPGKEAGK